MNYRIHELERDDEGAIERGHAREEKIVDREEETVGDGQKKGRGKEGIGESLGEGTEKDRDDSTICKRATWLKYEDRPLIYENSFLEP